MRLLQRHSKWAFALALLAGAGLAAQTFENDQVLINEKHGQPHDHKLNRVMVYFNPGGESLDYTDGHTVELKWKAGEVKWSPASGMHTSEVTKSPRAFPGPVLVDIGIKTPGNPAKVAMTALDPLKVAPNIYTLEFENSQVRVFRARVGPRELGPMHEHFLNRVIVYLTDQNVRTTSADGTSQLQQHKRGEFSWSAGHAKHREQNLSDKPLEAVIVELKN